TIGLSLVIVGMLDNAALAPLASIAAADSNSWTVRAGFFVVAIAGVAAAFVVGFLPQFAATRRVMRYRIGRWLGEHTQCRKESLAATGRSSFGADTNATRSAPWIRCWRMAPSPAIPVAIPT